LSYNLLYGAGTERQWDSALPVALVGRNRLPELLSFIKQANPDIWGIEEANGWDRGTPPMIRQVADELSMNSVLVTTPLDFHLGLLSKFAILESQDLSPEVGRRGALRATLQSPQGQRLNVFVVHLDPSSSDARLCEVNTLLRLAQPYLHEPTLLIGDFNFRPDSAEYARLAQAAKSIAVEKSWGIDQIWIFPPTVWSSTSWFQSLTLPSGISDHTPVGAEINLYPSATTVPTPLPLSPTPAPALPAIVSETVAGAKVSHFDGFDNVCPFAVWTSRWKTERVSNGILEIAGEAPWQASVSRYRDFIPGQAVLLRFRFTRGSEFEIGFENTAWNSDLYRRFGVNLRDDAAQAVLWQGAAGMRGENLKGDLYPKPDTWYQLLLALDKQNEFSVQMWEPGDPSHKLHYRERMGELPAQLRWTFSIGADEGQISMDDYTELSFDAFK
jgi:endonuclease/exonuclease/phosphatase family metal-dependent hydrolase